MTQAALLPRRRWMLGQEARTPGRTELDEIRSIIDAWIERYGKEASKLTAEQTRIAQGQDLFSIWLGLWGGTLGIAAHPAEAWEATRLVAFRLLNESTKFARRYGNLMTEEQFQLSALIDKQLLALIDTAEQYAEALRPEVLEFVERVVAGYVQVLAEVSTSLGEFLRKVGLTALEVPDLAFDLIRWLRDHLGLLLVGGGVLAAGVLGLSLWSKIEGR